MEMLENVWKKLRSTKGDAHKMVKGLRMIEGPIWKMWMDNTEVVSIKSCKTVFTRVIEGKELAKYAQYCDTWGKGIVNFFCAKNRIGMSSLMTIRWRMVKMFGSLLITFGFR